MRPDRSDSGGAVQGLLYDAMRTADAAGVLVAQAHCGLQAPGRASMQLFVRDTAQQPLADDAALLSLLHQLLYTIARPLSVAVRPRLSLCLSQRNRPAGSLIDGARDLPWQPVWAVLGWARRSVWTSG